MSENHFAKALHNFTMEVACNDAIRSLTDKGLTIDKIKETLTFPAPMDHVAKVMLERLYETRAIVIPGSENNASEQFETKEIYDSYGRKSFLRVKKESPEEVIFSPEDYVSYENMLVLKRALEQVSSLSGHIPLKDHSTGSHPDM